MGKRRDHRRDTLIMQNASLVRAIARRYRGRGVSGDDLVQTGYLGLIQAVDRYDPGRGVPLSGYAARMIEGEILHLFRDQGWSVRVPRGLQELGRRASRAADDLAHSLGREPELSEIAAALAERPEAVAEALEARNAFHATSLSAGDDDGERHPLVDDAGYDGVIDRDLVARAMSTLPPRERRILVMRFQREMTQAEIAERIGISQMHVSRLLRRSLDRLRDGAELAA